MFAYIAVHHVKCVCIIHGLILIPLGMLLFPNHCLHIFAASKSHITADHLCNKPLSKRITFQMTAISTTACRRKDQFSSKCYTFKGLQILHMILHKHMRDAFGSCHIRRIGPPSNSVLLFLHFHVDFDNVG